VALMDNIPGWKVFSAGIGIAALAVGGYLVWHFFFKGPDDLKALQNQAVVHALDQIAAEYADKVRTRGEQRVIVMPVQKDTSNGQIREMLIGRLNAVEGVKADVPRTPSLEERASAIVRSLVAEEENQPDPAGVFADAAEADEVISVAVAKLWSGADSGVCDLDVYRIARDDSMERKAKILEPARIKGLSGSAIVDGEPADTGPGFWAGAWAFLWRALVVLAAAAIMPLLSWPLAKSAFRQDSNAMNAALLLGLTALDLLVLFALASFQFTTTAVIAAGLLLPVALVYNLRMLNFMEEQ
jgi:hypothetical protein